MKVWGSEKGLGRFVDDLRALEEQRLQAKLEACPHCRRVGTLNAHGFVSGYSEVGPARVVRGRRFFCSNRFRRPGCGHTFSVLLAHVLARFVVGTRTLSRFVKSVLSGVCRKIAWASVSGMSVSSGYRLWRRLSEAQPHMRTRLWARCSPPGALDARPWSELLAHFEKALPAADCVFARFQAELQIDLLP